MSGFIRLFEHRGHAAIYAKARPHPHKSIVEHLLTLVEAEKRLLAVDVGCGSGQFTFQLQRHFKRIVGLDVSEAQIAEAKKIQAENVEFIVGDESLSSIPGKVIAWQFGLDYIIIKVFCSR